MFCWLRRRLSIALVGGACPAGIVALGAADAAGAVGAAGALETAGAGEEVASSAAKQKALRDVRLKMMMAIIVFIDWLGAGFLWFAGIMGQCPWEIR